ncbi:MAG: hypothetical protein ACLGI7_06760 [Gammaproteobacteria bacterium]
MSTAAYASIAVALSAAPLVRLALRDPKRLRSLRIPAAGARRGPRAVLAALCLMPGAVLGALGQWPAFLIWLGALAAGGWLLVLLIGGTVPGEHV